MYLGHVIASCKDFGKYKQQAYAITFKTVKRNKYTTRLQYSPVHRDGEVRPTFPGPRQDAVKDLGEIFFRLDWGI